MNLKTLLLTGLTALSLNTLKAQAVQDTIAKDTVTTLKQEKNDLKLTHLYAGSYAIGTFDQQSFETGKVGLAGNIRAGGRAVWKISDKVSANALLAYDQSTGSEGKMLHLAAVDYTPVAGTKITAGRTANAATQLVDLPVAPGGHFLFTAEGDAVSPGLGIKVNQSIGDATVAVSGMVRDGGGEPSVMFTKGSFLGAVVLDPSTKKVNGGMSYIADITNGANIFSMVWLKPESFSLSALYTSANKISFFIDGKYDREEQLMKHIQIGVLKSMKQDKLGAKLGAGYDIVNKTFQTVLFVTLGGKR